MLPAPQEACVTRVLAHPISLMDHVKTTGAVGESGQLGQLEPGQLRQLEPGQLAARCTVAVTNYAPVTNWQSRHVLRQAVTSLQYLSKNALWDSIDLSANSASSHCFPDAAWTPCSATPNRNEILSHLSQWFFPHLFRPPLVRYFFSVGLIAHVSTKIIYPILPCTSTSNGSSLC